VGWVPLPPDSLNSKKNYLKQAQETQNPLICPLIEEYISSRSEIEREGLSPSILTGVEKIT